jgi:hypothetical protein
VEDHHHQRICLRAVAGNQADGGGESTLRTGPLPPFDSFAFRSHTISLRNLHSLIPARTKISSACRIPIKKFSYCYMLRHPLRAAFSQYGYAPRALASFSLLSTRMHARIGFQ